MGKAFGFLTSSRLIWYQLIQTLYTAHLLCLTLSIYLVFMVRIFQHRLLFRLYWNTQLLTELHDALPPKILIILISAYPQHHHFLLLETFISLLLVPVSATPDVTVADKNVSRAMEPRCYSQIFSRYCCFLSVFEHTSTRRCRMIY